MEKYNYKGAIRADTIKFLLDNEINLNQFDDYEDAFNYIYDELFDEDMVTGNLSGYDSAAKCEEYLVHNLDLMFEALDEFCVGIDELSKIDRSSLPVYLDCTIRCNLLPYAVDEAISYLKNIEHQNYKSTNS